MITPQESPKLDLLLHWRFSPNLPASLRLKETRHPPPPPPSTFSRFAGKSGIFFNLSSSLGQRCLLPIPRPFNPRKSRLPYPSGNLWTYHWVRSHKRLVSTSAHCKMSIVSKLIVLNWFRGIIVMGDLWFHVNFLSSVNHVLHSLAIYFRTGLICVPIIILSQHFILETVILSTLS